MHPTNATRGGPIAGSLRVLSGPEEGLEQRHETSSLVTRWMFSGNVPARAAEPLHAYFRIERGNRCKQ
jgi:hypothetical protein